MGFGYKAITPIKLLNGVSAYRSGSISFKALRVYIACFELEAVREAARRSQRAKGLRGGGKVRYRPEELTVLTGGLSRRSIGVALLELRKSSLLHFSEEKMAFTEFPVGATKELLQVALCGRKGTRAVPVPRRLIRFMGGLKKPSLTLTLIGYLLRGLSIDRGTGEVNPRGTLKASWGSRVFGLSLRAVKGARRELIELGIISKDENSFQRKLNRDGAYFEINLGWGSTTSETSKRHQKDIKNESSHLEFAPPKRQKYTEFAPPKERLKTSNEVKNQKTRRADPAGVYKQTSKGGRPPTLRDIQPEDLREFSRNEALYFQARARGLISSCEADALNWLAASVRARETENPGRVFMGILKGKLFHHITHAQEDQARRALARRRELFPEAFRAEISQEITTRNAA